MLNPYRRLCFKLVVLFLLIASAGVLRGAPASTSNPTREDVDCLKQYNDCTRSVCGGFECKFCQAQLAECGIARR